ncbi:MAG: ATP-dependent helicase HrpB [Xanthobacteraceae bacterium]
MNHVNEPLPIDCVLPQLCTALRVSNAAVLVAPPGAGKTTRVPLVLAAEPWAKEKRIIVLAPRRLAARAAAARMARTLAEPVGATVGYRVRFGSKVSHSTRIEVVTEGIFTRRVLDDPALGDVAAVLFDEFHERSLEADLALALARDLQLGLREDLRIVVMSATIDGARIRQLLGHGAEEAALVESAGRAFPVETRYLGRDPRLPIERQVADAVMRALRAEAGSVLVFLPGAGEIRRTESLLHEGVLDSDVDVVALYGALEGDAQDRAIMPAPPGRRKVVLATSIAETSLTIEGVRVVIDCGLARVPRYEPDVGLTRLETVRVSHASAEQRRGRAGRIEPGVCYRLWDEAQTAALALSNRPEILTADLSGMVLDLAHWGLTDPASLAFLDPPPAAALAAAKTLLLELGAIDVEGRITADGRRLRELPLPPRLARMVVDAAARGQAASAALIALVLTERALGGSDVDLRHRLEEIARDRSARAVEARAMATRWAGIAVASRGPATEGTQSGQETMSAAALLALAYPDRVAKNRGADGAFLLANGRGAKVDPASALARETFLSVAEISGKAAQARIVLAAPLSLEEIEREFSHRIEEREEITFDEQSCGLRGRGSRRLGALLLADQPMPVVANEETSRMLAQGIARVGIERLPWTKGLRQWCERVMFLRRAEGEPWPDLSGAALADSADLWLAPALLGKTALHELAPDELTHALHQLVPWALRRRLEVEAPTHFVAPSGSSLPIDYGSDEGPKLAIRVQELFGLDRHPTLANGRIPLTLELLSPAHRPVQVTRDLPGFWRGSYAAVKSEMKGRYPRHPWPDDPRTALPTKRAKERAKPRWR